MLLLKKKRIDFTPLKNENQQKITLYLLQNKIHRLRKLYSKIFCKNSCIQSKKI